MSKYRNKRTVIGGVAFDSKKEAERYVELKLLEKSGIICELKLQPRYELIPAYTLNNKKVRKVEYVADFEYAEKGKGVVIEDVKGMKTEVYKLKKKLFEYIYKKEITEI